MPGWMPPGIPLYVRLRRGCSSGVPRAMLVPCVLSLGIRKGGGSSALSSSSVWHFWISGHLRLPITCRPLDNWGYLGLRDGRMPMAFLDPTSVLSWSIATFFSSGIVGVLSPCGSFALPSSPDPSRMWFLGYGSEFLLRNTIDLSFLLVTVSSAVFGPLMSSDSSSDL